MWQCAPPLQAVTYGDLFTAACAAREVASEHGESPRVALIPAHLNPATIATILGLIAARTIVVALDPELPGNRVESIAAILSEHDYVVARLGHRAYTGRDDGGPRHPGRRCRYR